MSATSSPSSAPCFAEEEEKTGIHLRPTARPSSELTASELLASCKVSELLALVANPFPPEMFVDESDVSSCDEDEDEDEDDVLDDADIVEAELASTPISEELRAIESAPVLVVDTSPAKTEEEAPMVAQASLPPPAPHMPEWEALMYTPPPRRVRFRRKLVASAAAAFLTGLLVVSAAVDQVATPDDASFRSVRSTMAVGVATPMSVMTSAETTDVISIPMTVIPKTTARAAAVAPASVPTVAAAPAPAPAAARKASTLSMADRALAAGDFADAESAYQAILVRGGADHEALTGLGNVAAARNRTTDAMAFYERALARNDRYLPARLGLADALWSAGRNDAAIAHYRAIRASFANDVYPTRVIDRSR